MFLLFDDKGVIHIPKLMFPWIGGSAEALASKSSINRTVTKGLMGESMAQPWTC